MTSPLRLMVAAGGTGGHVFPALAVAKVLEQRGVEVSWIGTQRGLEARVVPANEISIHWVQVEGLRGKHRISLLLAPFKLLRAIWQCVRVLREFKPNAVLGMGGFVAGPAGLSARLLSIPLIVHEQNAVAGLTNRYLAKLATRVLSGFNKPLDLHNNAEWVGNPVRENIAAIDPNNRRVSATERHVLVTGGSQGALSFNRYLPKLLAECERKLAAGGVRLIVWHQCGKDRKLDTQACYESAGLSPMHIVEFIDDMAQALTWADVVICRAGAMSLAEVCAAGLASVLVPYPYSAGDHQELNAAALVSAGAAITLTDQSLSAIPTVESMLSVLRDVERIGSMGAKARSLYKPDALDRTVEICEEVLNA